MSGASSRAQALLRQAYATRRVPGRSGAPLEVHSEIDPDEGEFLYRTVRADPDIRRTLEVGCAFGFASLQICSALEGRPDASHTIVEQDRAAFDDAGVAQLERAGIDWFRVIERPSEYALPDLAEAGESFDFVFIDGWHTFDHTLVDAFFATRLLRVGGYLAIDDVHFPSVRRAVDVLTTWPCYDRVGAVTRPRRLPLLHRFLGGAAAALPRALGGRLIARPFSHRVFDPDVARLVLLRKVAADARDWDWHSDAF